MGILNQFDLDWVQFNRPAKKAYPWPCTPGAAAAPAGLLVVSECQLSLPCSFPLPSLPLLLLTRRRRTTTGPGHAAVVDCGGSIEWVDDPFTEKGKCAHVLCMYTGSIEMETRKTHLKQKQGATPDEATHRHGWVWIEPACDGGEKRGLV